jgi:hypothetical protein
MGVRASLRAPRLISRALKLNDFILNITLGDHHIYINTIVLKPGLAWRADPGLEPGRV